LHKSPEHPGNFISELWAEWAVDEDVDAAVEHQQQMRAVCEHVGQHGERGFVQAEINIGYWMQITGFKMKISIETKDFGLR